MVEKLFGELRAGWRYLSLGEVCFLGGGNVQTGPFGSQLHASDYVIDGIPSIMPANIGDNRIIPNGIARIRSSDAERLSKYRVRIGDIVYSRRGDVERRSLIRKDEDGWLCGTGCLRVRLGNGMVSPEYASHYLGAPAVKEWIVRHAHGATMPNLNTSILSACPFVLPPLSDQKSIAHVLEELEGKIELNRQMNETLEAMARAIFKDWFVDFGPTRAKMASTKPYLAPDIWKQFPDRLDDEGKPEGWEQRRVEDVLDLAYGKALPASERADGRVPVYGSGGVTGFHSESLVNGPSVIVGRKGTVGSLFWEDEAFFPIDTVFFVVPKVPLTFCFYLLKSLGLEEMNTDAAVPGLNRNNVYRLTVPWSSEAIRNSFDTVATAMRSKIRANTDESRTLSDTRNLLLPKLMSGEIRISENKKSLEFAS
jgi:type I restriction enzyme S subunit